MSLMDGRRRGGVSEHPGMRGLLCGQWSTTHPKANCDQGTRSGDGGSTSTTAGASRWPKLGNFLIIPYGFHSAIHSHHEDRIVVRGSYRLWLGTGDKDRFAGMIIFFKVKKKKRVLVVQ